MRYLALQWSPGDEEAAGWARRAIALLDRLHTWTPACRAEGLSVHVSPGEGRRVAAWGRSGAIIGDCYRKSDGACGRAFAAREDAPGLAAAGRLAGEVFGRYVAIASHPEPVAFRDPSGALDCLVWRRGPLTLIGSDLEATPPDLRPPHLRLSWPAIARCLGSATASTAELALEGLDDVPPGACRMLTPTSEVRTVWTPSAFVRPRRTERPEDLAAELSARVSLSVQALVARHDRMAAEVSGGLDSAIVAGVLARLGRDDSVVHWFNYYSDRPEGDERAYGQAVTDRIGATLTAVPLQVRALRAEDFADVAADHRPPMNALVPTRDQAVAAQLRASGATALISGQGGDAALFQMPSALILADELRAMGPAALATPVLRDLSTWLRRSCWGVLAAAVRKRRPKSQPWASIALVPHELAQRAHPWIRDAHDAPPAKQLQIVGLANAHVATGACRITRYAELIYPLMAQPVVAFCLGVPAAVLTEGGRERGLARRAFADLLPSAILHRRKKGELTAFHTQTVAASLDFLRPHLLDGVLCAAGLLDRRRLEAALQPNDLLWRGDGGDILVAAALESWVRHWQRYIPDSLICGRDTVLRDGARWAASQAKARA